MQTNHSIKLYSIEQIRSLEESACTKYSISLTTLMDRAGRAAFNALEKYFPDAKKIAVICGSIVTAMCSMLVLMSQSWQAYIYGLLFGLGAPFIIVGIILLGIQVIPNKQYSTIWSRVVMVQTLTFAVGTWMNGMLFDIFGHYRIGFSICAVMGVLTIIGLTSIKQESSFEKNANSEGVNAMIDNKAG